MRRSADGLALGQCLSTSTSQTAVMGACGEKKESALRTARLVSRAQFSDVAFSFATRHLSTAPSPLSSCVRAAAHTCGKGRGVSHRSAESGHPP